MLLIIIRTPLQHSKMTSISRSKKMAKANFKLVINKQHLKVMKKKARWNKKKRERRSSRKLKTKKTMARRQVSGRIQMKFKVIVNKRTSKLRACSAKRKMTMKMMTKIRTTKR